MDAKLYRITVDVPKTLMEFPLRYTLCHVDAKDFLTRILASVDGSTFNNARQQADELMQEAYISDGISIDIQKTRISVLRFTHGNYDEYYADGVN